MKKPSIKSKTMKQVFPSKPPMKKMGQKKPVVPAQRY